MIDVLIRDTEMWIITFPVTARIEKVGLDVKTNYMSAHTREEAIEKAAERAGHYCFCTFDPGDFIQIENRKAQLFEQRCEPNSCSPCEFDRFLRKIGE